MFGVGVIVVRGGGGCVSGIGVVGGGGVDRGDGYVHIAS